MGRKSALMSISDLARSLTKCGRRFNPDPELLLLRFSLEEEQIRGAEAESGEAVISAWSSSTS